MSCSTGIPGSSKGSGYLCNTVLSSTILKRSAQEL